MAYLKIIQPRGSQEPVNWTNRGLTPEMTTEGLTGKQKLFISVLVQVNGNISKACSIAGQSRQTYYNWLEDEDQTFADTIAVIQFEAVERRIDLAEEKLDDRLHIGSGPDVRFVLKTLGAKRGYGKKSEVTISPGEGFKDMEWPDETPDLEQWEAERDKHMPPATATQSQQGTHDQSDAQADDPKGDGPDSADRL